MVMSSSTKIVVLRSKELVYSIVLLIVSILIILVAVSIFMPSGGGSKSNPSQSPQNTQPTQDFQTPSESTQQGMLSDTPQAQEMYDSSQLYVPGIYTGVLQLGSSVVELQLTVDKNHINSINFTNIDDAVATMYPLMQPTLSELSSAIIENQSLDNVTYAEESRYTSMLLLNTISDLLEKARASENADSPAQLTDSLNMQ